VASARLLPLADPGDQETAAKKKAAAVAAAGEVVPVEQAEEPVEA
jgi:hypothetical protein